MAFTKTWDESKPAGSRDISLGDDDIREFKFAIRERLAVDHEFAADESGNSNIGMHKTIQMIEVEGSDPTNAANKGFLYLKDVNSKIELHFIDEDGNVIQLTSAGILNFGRTSDLLLSANTNTPTGWTDVSTTYDNQFLRIGDDTPLTTTGGSNTLAGNSGNVTLTALQSGLREHLHSYSFGQYPNANTGANVERGDGTLQETPSRNTDNVAAAAAQDAHAHALTSVACVPAYIQTRMYKKD